MLAILPSKMILFISTFLNLVLLPFLQGFSLEKHPVNAPLSFGSQEQFPVQFEQVVLESFEEYVKTFNISFENDKQEIKRREIFEKNLKEMKAYNLEHEVKKGTTMFSALTYEEIISQHTGAHITAERMKMLEELPEFQPSSRNLPANYDWRSVSGAVTNVKNQGACGSCWAFAATAAIETHQFLKTGVTMDLSEQSVLDCTYPGFYDGCGGGWGLSVYVEKQEMYSEASNPYTGSGDHSCSDPGSEVLARVSGAMKVQSFNEEAMRQALVEYGPLDVSIFVAEDFHSWDWSKVYRSQECNLHWSNHEVLIVGYGETEDGDKYWTVKNSWGTGWAREGYFRIARGEDMCGIEFLPIFPLISLV